MSLIVHLVPVAYFVSNIKTSIMRKYSFVIEKLRARARRVQVCGRPLWDKINPECKIKELAGCLIGLMVPSSACKLSILETLLSWFLPLYATLCVGGTVRLRGCLARLIISLMLLISLLAFVILQSRDPRRSLKTTPQRKNEGERER